MKTMVVRLHLVRTRRGGIYGPDDSYTAGAMPLEYGAVLVSMVGALVGGGACATLDGI